MEIKYIIALVSVSIFALIFLLYVLSSAKTRARDEILRESIERMYADKNLARMEYDFAICDEETSRLISGVASREEQLSIEDVMAAEAAAADGFIFGAVDTEGIEEITGNYKPE